MKGTIRTVVLSRPHMSRWCAAESASRDMGYFGRAPESGLEKALSQWPLWYVRLSRSGLSQGLLVVFASGGLV